MTAAPAPLRPARNERFSIPLTTEEKSALQALAAQWGRNQTEFAREVLMNAIRRMPPPAPAPKNPLPTPEY